MSTSATTLYDRVRYRTLPLSQTHPDRLATVATLLGMRPQPVGRCRVLEIGCGDGSNLIPIAYAFPESRFFGFDLAPSAVARGTTAIRSLGLTNIELCPLDIMDITDALGAFDYVIAHGVYSWVPEPVRDRLLAICKAHLAPHGVAYVSYNTYPGCHIRQAARRTLQFHVEGIGDPEERIGQARALARFIADTPPYGDSTHFQDEMRSVLEHTPGLLFHDDLAPTNDPVYFYEFIQHGHRHGLQFLAEANVWDMQDRIYPEEVVAQLRQLSDGNVVLKEQYLDFLKNRRFRQTLLCHDGVTLDRALRSAAIEHLFVASSARATDEKPDIASPSAVVEFRGPRSSGMSTDHPLAKAAVFYLGTMWPRAVALAELAGQARAILDESADSVADAPGEAAPDVRALCDILMNAYSAGLVELSTTAPTFTLEVSEYPTVSPIARLQAERGDDFVATLRHGSLHIEDPLARHVLCLLDGSRDRAALLRDMQAFIAAGVAGPPPSLSTADGSRPPFPPTANAEGLERKLVELARLALLLR